jgi:hypothetical protein
LCFFLWTDRAVADLYRWVDPETGSVKFSSYPPPWYGDEAKQRNAPKVEVIAPRGKPQDPPRPDDVKPKPVPAPPGSRE